MIKKLVGIFILLSFYTKIYSQTCIIAYVSKNEIIVGADSRQNLNLLIKNEKGQTQRIRRRITVDKIVNVENKFYALAGAPDSITRKYASKSIKEAKGISDVCIKFVKYMTPELKKFWDKAKTIDSNYFLNNIQPCEVLFFWYEGNNPNVALVLLTPKFNDSSTSFYFDNSIMDISSNYQTAIPLGHYDAIKNEVFEKRNWESGNIVDKIKNLINKQAKSTPDIVGGPVDIIKVTPIKSTWIYKK